jgi:hypothetical protein
MRLFLVLAALVAFGAAAPVAADVIYTTGDPVTIWNATDQVETWLGLTSGYVNETMTSRRTSMDFTIAVTGPKVKITGITAFWFDSDDNAGLVPYTELGWSFYDANAGNMGPIAPALRSGTLPKGDIVNDPFGGDPRTWKHTFDIDPVILGNGGEYYLALYGVDGAIAWLVGAPEGPPDLKVYRSLNGDDFAEYHLPAQYQPKEGQPAEDVYHLGFTLYGEVIPEPATTSLLAGSLLALGALIRRRR